MKTPVKLLLSLTFLLFLGILNIKSVFAIDKCTTVEKNFNNHIDIIFKNIKSLEILNLSKTVLNQHQSIDSNPV